MPLVEDPERREQWLNEFERKLRVRSEVPDAKSKAFRGLPPLGLSGSPQDEA
jgi:hypothetical protein